MAKKSRSQRANREPLTLTAKGALATKKERLPAEAKNLMQQGMVSFRSENWEAAEIVFSQAWTLAPESFTILTALSQTYSELGDRARAIEFLEQALAIHGPNETLLCIMGQMALRMSAYDIAEKVWRLVLGVNADEPSYYENLSFALINQDKYDEALNLLKDVVYQFPTTAGIWNSLGVAAQHKHMFREAMAFFQEALKHDDQDYRIWSNIASLHTDRPTVLNFTQKALALNPDCHETHINMAYFSFSGGFLPSAWVHFEHRLAPQRAKGQNVTFKTAYPRWNGEDLTGKTILIGGEQGIGDEVFFYKSLSRIYAKAQKMIVACEPRLVTILQRTFPSALVMAYETEATYGYSYRSFPALDKLVEDGAITVDYFSPIASTWPLTWGNKKSDIPTDTQGYLTADPKLVETWKERLSILNGTLNIGISWESQNKARGRAGGYTNLDFWKDIAQIEGVNLICLQYGDVQDEITAFQDQHGKPIHTWPDLDLKQDIEGNLALMANLDLVIGPAIATQMFSLALGQETYLIARGRPWWNFGQSQDEKDLWYAPNLHWVDNDIHQLPVESAERESFNFWQDVAAKLQHKIAAMVS